MFVVVVVYSSKFWFTVRPADHFTKLQDCKTKCDLIPMRESRQESDVIVIIFVDVFHWTEI